LFEFFYDWLFSALCQTEINLSRVGHLMMMIFFTAQRKLPYNLLNQSHQSQQQVQNQISLLPSAVTSNGTLSSCMLASQQTGVSLLHLNDAKNLQQQQQTSLIWQQRDASQNNADAQQHGALNSQVSDEFCSVGLMNIDLDKERQCDVPTL
jgi:hypothetical protein